MGFLHPIILPPLSFHLNLNYFLINTKPNLSLKKQPKFESHGLLIPKYYVVLLVNVPYLFIYLSTSSPNLSCLFVLLPSSLSCSKRTELQYNISRLNLEKRRRRYFFCDMFFYIIIAIFMVRAAVSNKLNQRQKK